MPDTRKWARFWGIAAFLPSPRVATLFGSAEHHPERQVAVAPAPHSRRVREAAELLQP